MLRQTLRSGQNHLRHLDVMLRHFIEGGVDHISVFQTPLHVGHFLRPFVHQQHDHLRVRIMLLNAACDLLQKYGLTGLRRCDDEASLPLSDGSHQVDESERKVSAVLQYQPFIREDRRQRFKIRTLDSHSRLVSIDGYYVQQCAKAVSVIGMSADSFDFIAGL